MPADSRVSPEALLERQLPRLHAFVRLRAGQAFRARESCSDLVQSVCREALERARDTAFADESSFCQWLFIKALDKVRDRHDYHRAQRRDPAREVTPPADTASGYEPAYASLLTPSRVAIGREDVTALERAFDALPANYREVISLAKLAGLANGEIADRLQMTPKQVADALHRGLGRLRYLLSKSD